MTRRAFMATVPAIAAGVAVSSSAPKAKSLEDYADDCIAVFGDATLRLGPLNSEIQCREVLS